MTRQAPCSPRADRRLHHHLDQLRHPRELRRVPDSPSPRNSAGCAPSFSLAIAIQNLAWGIGQPIFGAMADRFGNRRAIVLGA